MWRQFKKQAQVFVGLTNEYDEIRYLRYAALLLSLLIPGLNIIGASQFIITIAKGVSLVIGTMTTHSDAVGRIIDGSAKKADKDVLRDYFGLRLLGAALVPAGFVSGQISSKAATLASRMLMSTYRRRNDIRCAMTDDQYKLYMIYQSRVSKKIPL